MDNLVSEKATSGKNVKIAYAMRIYGTMHIEDNRVIDVFESTKA